MLARVVDGARFTLGGAAAATGIEPVRWRPVWDAGRLLRGLIADGMVMRVTDLLLAFPYFPGDS